MAQPPRVPPRFVPTLTTVVDLPTLREPAQAPGAAPVPLGQQAGTDAVPRAPEPVLPSVLPVDFDFGPGLRGFMEPAAAGPAPPRVGDADEDVPRAAADDAADPFARLSFDMLDIDPPELPANVAAGDDDAQDDADTSTPDDSGGVSSSGARAARTAAEAERAADQAALASFLRAAEADDIAPRPGGRRPGAFDASVGAAQDGSAGGARGAQAAPAPSASIAASPSPAPVAPRTPPPAPRMPLPSEVALGPAARFSEFELLGLEEEVLHRVMQRVDLKFEQQISDVVAAAVQEQLDQMIPRLRGEIEQALRAIVADALAKELLDVPGSVRV